MIWSRRTLLKTGLALPAFAATPPRSHMRTLEGTGRVWDIWRVPGRFTKNPDIIRSPNGRMMLVFCETDQHWALKFSRITTLESTDGGKTWGNPRVIAEADIQKGEERWVTPRLSRAGQLVFPCCRPSRRFWAGPGSLAALASRRGAAQRAARGRRCARHKNDALQVLGGADPLVRSRPPGRLLFRENPAASGVLF